MIFSAGQCQWPIHVVSRRISLNFEINVHFLAIIINLKQKLKRTTKITMTFGNVYEKRDEKKTVIVQHTPVANIDATTVLSLHRLLLNSHCKMTIMQRSELGQGSSASHCNLPANAAPPLRHLVSKFDRTF